MLPEVGTRGQQRLRDARVLIVGAGGLGSPAALYLAAAGVGHLGMVEFDRVDATNLHRQLLYGTGDIGRSKVAAARERIHDTNPQVVVEPYETRLTAENALGILRNFDIVVDGSDNFPTRYVVNDASVISGIPCVYGSIHRFEGQVSVFGAQGGPCYRCLFREPPPAGAVPNCAEAGVFGVLPGIVGTLQATEVLKLILGIGDPLIGRLLLVDALGMSFRTIELRRDPECPTCGASRSGSLVDYERICGVDERDPDSSQPASSRPEPWRGGASVSGIRSITPTELAERLERGDEVDLVDVREQYEWEIGRLPGARLVPLSSFGAALDSFDARRETIVYCKVGMRSLNAAEQLVAAGITNVFNLTGGIMRWREEVDVSIPEY
jgi:molybdopterin/thiamine biosynthesis adenylyltransferase/rhodanese-related sulfurtransferase